MLDWSLAGGDGIARSWVCLFASGCLYLQHEHADDSVDEVVMFPPIRSEDGCDRLWNTHMAPCVTSPWCLSSSDQASALPGLLMTPRHLVLVLTQM